MRKLLLFSFLFCFVLTAHAQLKYNVYARAGFNINRLNSTLQGDTTTYRSGAGPHFGIAMDFKVDDRLYFQPEFLISRKLVKSQDDFVRARYSATYFDIPLLLRYHLSPDFSFIGGLQISLLAGGNQEKNIELPGGSPRFVEEKITDFSGSDVAFLVGFDVRLDNEFHLGLRVGTSSGDVTVNDTKTVRMNMIQLSFAYLWKKWEAPQD